MKTLAVFLTLSYACFGQNSRDSSFTIENKIPVKIIVNPVNLNFPKDTIHTTGRSVLVFESAKDIATKMADTTYLDKIVGTYLVGNSNPEIIIKRKSKNLIILIPNHLESELIPKNSSFFILKNDPDTMISLFFDQKANIAAINIQNTKENYAANRKDYHY